MYFLWFVSLYKQRNEQEGKHHTYRIIKSTFRHKSRLTDFFAQKWKTNKVSLCHVSSDKKSEKHTGEAKNPKA